MLLTSCALALVFQAQLPPSIQVPPAPPRSPEVLMLEDALAWLAGAQSADGAWREPAGTPGSGGTDHLVGNSALAVLAFMSNGNTSREGPYREAVLRTLTYLRAQQDAESGLVGEQVGHAFLYDHALAAFALAQAYRLDRSPLLKAAAQKAANYSARARNPYGAWRYDVPPVGDNDTSITFWFALGLKEARDARLKTDSQAFRGTLDWLDSVTDSETMRTGYDSAGSRSSRILGRNDNFPADRYEAMTGAAVALRILLAPEKATTGRLFGELAAQRTLLERALPGADMLDTVAFHHGALAAYLLGGRTSARWHQALGAALGATQRRGADDPLRGSWNPDGPWGFMSGRVGTTALAVLALSTPWRVADDARLVSDDDDELEGELDEIEAEIEVIEEEAFEERPEVAAAYGGLTSPMAAAQHWLLARQARDGSWPTEDGLSTTTIATTALAVLALEGLAEGGQAGATNAAVAAGVRYLLHAQDSGSGRIGEAVSHTFHYAHAIATLALARTAPSASDADGEHRAALQRAVNYALRARNPYGAWRYDCPPVGDNDTSVTTWMVLALVAAKDAGAKLDLDAFAGAQNWFAEVTELGTGRTGYDSVGSRSSRVYGVNDSYPTDSAETMTAAALAARKAMGNTRNDLQLLDRQHRLLDRSPPVARSGGPAGGDAFYWYFGSLALQGGPFVTPTAVRWRAGLTAELSGAQVTAGDHLGSWDARGPWGYALGRTGTTALALLSLRAIER